jgi:hypothetical protein
MVGYNSRWQDEEALYPLRLGRKKIVVELEVYSDVTDYNSHRINLTHPDMDGSLTFDIASLQEAEDTLEQLEFDFIEVETKPERVEKVEQPRVTEFRAYAAAQPAPRVEPRQPQPQPQYQPRVEPVQQTQKSVQPTTDVDMDASPFGSVLSDVSEICNLLNQVLPKASNIKKRMQGK